MKEKKPVLTILQVILYSILGLIPVIGVIFGSVLFFVWVGQIHVDIIPQQPLFMEQPANEGLKAALEYHELDCPDIVYAQAVLETGHFKSDVCLNNNNLFGLYNSKTKKYYKFNHWVESVVAYKEWIQKKYKPPEDYYCFLKRVHYASDPKYTNKLKKIVKQQ